MGLQRLFLFLLKLVTEEFYGEVKIRFQKGRVHGQIDVHNGYVEESLPLPEMADPKVQAQLAETLKGMPLV